MTLDDILAYHVPPPTPKSIRNDTRLSVLRPHFMHINTSEELVANSEKYKESNIQKVIGKNAARAFKMNPESTGLDLDILKTHIQMAHDLGIEGLLQKITDDRRSHMVQPIQPTTMIPPPDVHTTTSRPPYPTKEAMEAMQHVHKGIELIIDPNLLVSNNRRPRPKNLDLAMERAVRKQIDKGTMIALPQALFEELCQQQSIPYHDSSNFFVAKDRTDPDDAGRLIIDFKKSHINNPTSKQFYELQDGPYGDATVIDICIKILALAKMHPMKKIYICFADIVACFTRIPIAARNIPMLSTSFLKDDIRMVALSSGAPFGLNESNSTQKSITEAINAVVNHLDMTDLGRVTGTIYIDDMIAVRLWDEVLQFYQTRHATSDQFEGSDSISKDKSKFGQVIKTLGYLFNTIDKTIGASDTLIEKYIWAVCHLLPTHISIGTPIILHTAQVVSSYLHLIAITAYPLKAFSKGLARATRQVEQKAKSTVHLSADAIIDLQYHRQSSTYLSTMPVVCLYQCI